MKFTFTDDVYALGVRGVYFNIMGMQNRPSSDPAVVAFVATQLASIPDGLEASEAIGGFRTLHALVSNKADKLVASPSGLLSFYRSKGDIPQINGIVDVYNSISIASGIAIGAHDLSHVDGDIALRLTDGSEHFWPLGAKEPVKVPAGEYGYIDDGKDILCRLEVRQVEKTKIVPDSADVFFIVQGHDHMDPGAIETTSDTLINACLTLFGGSLVRLYP